MIGGKEPHAAPQRVTLQAALSLHKVGRREDAKRAYEELLRKNAGNYDALHLLGVLHFELGDAHRAEALIAKAISLKRNQAEFHCNYGLVLRSLGQGKDALTHFDLAVRLNKRYPAAYINRGVALQDLGRYEEALADFEESLKLERSAVGFTNRGILRRLTRHPELAVDDFSIALLLDKNYVEAQWSRALSLLDLGRYSEAWEGYEARHRHPGLARNIFRTTRPRYEQTMGVRRILIVGEQGLGEEILFLRALGLVPKLSEEIILTLNRKLQPIIARSPIFKRFAFENPVGTKVEYDAYLEIGSIYHAAMRSGATWSAGFPVPYLKSDSQRSAIFRNQCASDRKMLCGLSWRSQNAPYSEAKSMSLEDMMPIFGRRDVVWVSLQYGDVSAEIAQFKAKTGIEIVEFESVDNFNDLDGHAALIDACDYVVSVSNTTAHIAGALGKRGYIALPYARGMFFYWVPRDENSRSYWYPSLRLFDQGRDGDWTTVTRAIAESIQ